MADAQPEPVERPADESAIRIDPARSVSVFVTDTILTKPGESMFWLDFLQVDVSADPLGRAATVVARTVFTERLARQIVAQLTAALD